MRCYLDASLRWGALLVSLYALVLCPTMPARGEVGDPQIRTDHAWYPGELAISDFDRLFKTQAELYQRVTAASVDSDEDKAIAAWLWRNTHFWHGETGSRDLWGEGLGRGKDLRQREYWTGLFGYGFGLCGTTHSQWTAEFDQLLGHGRGRGVGAAGHNAFEVFLQGDAYGTNGRWALVDHDLSTIIFDDTGKRLLGLGEIQNDVDRWIKRGYKPQKQRGWLVCGLHPQDGESYRRYAVAEYLPGYAGPPPMVHLRRGERMRRYFQPGLDDGKTYVFWGRNYNTEGIPGPERSRSWVNQPEKMYGSKSGTPHRNGQVRYANVEYTYRPNFESEDYREAVVAEDDQQVIFEFRTPYVIGATPPNKDMWGIYEDGCRNGLTVTGNMECAVAISVNAGRTWNNPKALRKELDFTDAVKGRAQYWIRFGASAKQLRGSQLTMRTVCQANVAVLPRLKDGGTNVTYRASDRRVHSLGPELDLAKSFVVDGAFGEKAVTLAAPADQPVTKIYAAAHTASGSPPDPKVKYAIEYRLGSEGSWQTLVDDWSVPRRGDEPNDFWSQSFCYGNKAVLSQDGKPIQIRFRNDGGKRYLRAEAHFVQRTKPADPVRITYQWTDDSGEHNASHVFRAAGQWHVPTGKNVNTRWVETAAP